MTEPSGSLDGAPAGAGAARGVVAVGSVAQDAALSDPAIRERYRVVEAIAPGPEDALYLARRLDTGALVELRVLSGALGGDRVLLAALVQHGTLVARVSAQCPGIAALYECERTSRGLVLAMAHPEGPTLREVIKREGTLGFTRALGLALGLAKVLERGHDLGLVHGGLRPENVVLAGPDEDVVLTHFGFDWVLLSRSPDAEGRRASAADDPVYRAPEQAWDQTTPQSDIYAFGAILYEMLAGTPPPASVASRPRVSPEPLKNCRADVTPGLERLVTQTLQVAPERRPADMSVVVNALSAEISADRPPTPPEGRTVADPSAGTRTRKLFWRTGLTVLGALVICAAWFAYARMTPGTSSSPPLPQAPSSPASALGLPADEVPTQAAPADAPGPGVAHRATDDAPAPPEAASSPPSMARGTPPVERAADASDAKKPRTGLPPDPAVVTRPRPAAVTPEPAESPAMTTPPTTRADDLATTRRPAEPAAPRPQASRETGEAAGDDPGAIIDWLLNEGAGKER
jgi:serine/threonine protein kinase